MRLLHAKLISKYNLFSAIPDNLDNLATRYIIPIFIIWVEANAAWKYLIIVLWYQKPGLRLANWLKVVVEKRKSNVSEHSISS